MSSSDESVVSGTGSARPARPIGSSTSTMRGSERGSVARVVSGSPNRPGRLSLGAVIVSVIVVSLLDSACLQAGRTLTRPTGL